jgi:hypothetical protein
MGLFSFACFFKNRGGPTAPLVAIGCILTHEPNEERRKVVIGTLISAHRAAQAEFAAIASKPTLN